MNKNKIKKRVNEILDKSSDNDFPSRIFDIFIVTLIAINVVCVILETVQSIHAEYYHLFIILDTISIAVFIIEYILRVWSCTVHEKFSRPVIGRLRFMVTPMAIIDLLAIVPFFLLFADLDGRILRAVRLFRLFRLFKLGRYSESFKTLNNVLRAKKEGLAVNAFILFMLLIISSSLIYFLEHESQPEAFSSIPAAMWWGVATLTTVGYGDIYPITITGKIVGAFIAMLGIAMFALPAGVLASGFSDELRKKIFENNCCIYCGSPGEHIKPARHEEAVDAGTAVNAEFAAEIKDLRTPS
ncbi:MAG: ion transporter [Nitrospira sp.]|nr:ion transporter [Nitrospira sp.]